MSQAERQKEQQHSLWPPVVFISMSKLFREGQPSKQLSSLAAAEPELPEQQQRQRLSLPSLLCAALNFSCSSGNPFSN